MAKRPRPDSSLIGTPLDAAPNGAFVPVWKQEARDERGRKRFHGAFTGGFSAGYFNTVGSAEGWTPSTFVSSRSTRAAHVQRAEDFMDAEDIALEDEAQTLTTTDGIAGVGAFSQRSSGQHDALGSLIGLVPSRSIGASLLQKMGWRPGHGIGPWTSRRARLADDDRDEADEGDQSVDTHLFPPPRAQIVMFTHKDNRRGLGCGETWMAPPGAATGSDGSDDDASSNQLAGLRGRKPLVPRPTTAASAGGFGTGVLDESDDDDYAAGPKIVPVRARKDKAKGKTKPKTASGKLKREKGGSILANLAKSADLRAGPAQGRDGNPPLPGFRIGATEKTTTDVPPVTVPPGWKSKLSKQPMAESSSGSSQPATRPAHSIADRAEILGEQALPGKSVFDYISPAARERLVKNTGRSDLPAARGERNGLAPPQPEESAARVLAEHAMPPDAARSALVRAAAASSAYSDDLPKKGRYVAFLGWCAAGGFRGSGEAVQPPPPLLVEAHQQSRSAFVREVVEFGRTGRMFAGTGSMNDRFRAAGTQQDHDPAEADPATSAAGRGMYGQMTRQVEPWAPTRLLCRRFGVKFVDRREAAEDAEEAAAATADPTASAPKPVSAAGLKDPPAADEQSLGVFAQARPDEELFRAVFGDD